VHIESVWKKWEIPHLSASSINAWIASPARFVASKILGIEFPPGAAAMRGIAVEAGLVALAGDHKLPVDMAIELANRVISQEFQRHGIDPDNESARLELQRTRQCIQAGANAVRQHGLPLAVQPTDHGAQQHKIEYDLGLSIPVIGYLDLKFLGGIVDIKSTSRLPSKMSATHARQFALYASATGLRTAGLYVSPTGVKLLEVLDVKEHIETLRAAAFRLACFLSTFDSPSHLVAACPPPDLSSICWSSLHERAIAQSVFGIKS
jgi:hypothetical protein